MSESTQHIIVIAIIALCVGFLLWQGFGGFFGRKTMLGKCCETGCKPKQTVGKSSEQFLPIESLSRKR
jgi:hypothetical protein